MAVWTMLLIIFGAGLIGGTINALISDNGFVLPKKMSGIVRPGWLGNALIGGVGAIVSWSLYGPLAGAPIWTSSDQQKVEGTLTLAAVGGALLVGIAGARWLSNEVDKKLLRAAGTAAFEGGGKPPAGGTEAPPAPPSPADQRKAEALKALATGSPARALQAAQSIADEGPALRRQ